MGFLKLFFIYRIDNSTIYIFDSFHLLQQLSLSSSSDLVHDEAPLFLKFHFVLICNTNTCNFLHYVNNVVGDDVVQDELPLQPQIYRIEVLWCSRQVVSGAGTAGRFETVVLQGYKPGQG